MDINQLYEDEGLSDSSSARAKYKVVSDLYLATKGATYDHFAVEINDDLIEKAVPLLEKALADGGEITNEDLDIEVPPDALI